MAHTLDVVYDWCHAVGDDIAEPARSETDACDADNETNDSETLFPMGVMKFGMLRIEIDAIENLADHTQDIHGSHYDAPADPGWPDPQWQKPQTGKARCASVR